MQRPSLHGSCLCKTIEYQLDGLDMPIVHCHCQTCRKAHAAAFASTAGVMREHFRWTKGQDRLSSYESSPGKFRHFCSVHFTDGQGFLGDGVKAQAAGGKVFDPRFE